jgi:secondary thiamine-phosphate synthase enzyme
VPARVECAINTRRSEAAWGYSSVGRASRSHREGQGFESPYLHLSTRETSHRPVENLIEFTVATPAREAFVDITERVEASVREARVPLVNGVITVFVPHTTAAVTINEGADPAVCQDILAGLRGIAPRDAEYRHAEGNSDAHIKASLLGSHVSVPVSEGRLRLGTWQAIYLAEFDGPRSRKVWIIPSLG